MAKESLYPGYQGRGRRRLIQIHRLLEFEAAFDSYLAGKVSADFVKQRAKKMLEIGLPRFK